MTESIGWDITQVRWQKIWKEFHGFLCNMRIPQLQHTLGRRRHNVSNSNGFLRILQRINALSSFPTNKMDSF